MNPGAHPALISIAPGCVGDLTPQALANWPTTLEPPVIVDVREDWEVALAALPQALCIPLGSLGTRLNEINKERDIVLLCHHGMRSHMAARFLVGQGFPRVFNLSGGIDAWSLTVDPSLPRY